VRRAGSPIRNGDTARDGRTPLGRERTAMTPLCLIGRFLAFHNSLGYAHVLRDATSCAALVEVACGFRLRSVLELSSTTACAKLVLTSSCTRAVATSTHGPLHLRAARGGLTLHLAV
jgi:hypothetical protein